MPDSTAVDKLEHLHRILAQAIKQGCAHAEPFSEIESSVRFVAAVFLNRDMPTVESYEQFIVENRSLLDPIVFEALRRAGLRGVK